MAETNATGWAIDDYNVEDIDKTDDGSVQVSLWFHASGDQEDDRPYAGTQIDGHAEVTIQDDGSVEYEVQDVDKGD